MARFSFEFAGRVFVGEFGQVLNACGFVLCVQPCPLLDWELHVHFRVHGAGTDLFGDGLVIWYTKHRLEPGQ